VERRGVQDSRDALVSAVVSSKVSLIMIWALSKHKWGRGHVAGVQGGGFGESTAGCNLLEVGFLLPEVIPEPCLRLPRSILGRTPAG